MSQGESRHQIAVHTVCPVRPCAIMMNFGDFCQYDGDTYTCSARCVGPRVNCTVLLLRVQGLHELCHLQRAVCKRASQVNCNLLCTVCVFALTASQQSKSLQKPKKNKVTGVIRIQR